MKRCGRPSPRECNETAKNQRKAKAQHSKGPVIGGSYRGSRQFPPLDEHPRYANEKQHSKGDRM